MYPDLKITHWSEILPNTEYLKIKKKENFLGKGAFGGVYKVNVDGQWEAWKFVTFDTLASNKQFIMKNSKGFDGKEWARGRVEGRLKELIGNNIIANIDHPNIVKIINPVLFHRTEMDEYLDH